MYKVEYYSTVNKNEIMQFSNKLMRLEKECEVTQAPKDKCHMLPIIYVIYKHTLGIHILYMIAFFKKRHKF